MNLLEQAARCRSVAESISHPVRTTRRKPTAVSSAEQPSYFALACAKLHVLGCTSKFESTEEIYMYHLFLVHMLESEHGSA